MFGRQKPFLLPVLIFGCVPFISFPWGRCVNVCFDETSLVLGKCFDVEIHLVNRGTRVQMSSCVKLSVLVCFCLSLWFSLQEASLKCIYFIPKTTDCTDSVDPVWKETRLSSEWHDRFKCSLTARNKFPFGGSKRADKFLLSLKTAQSSRAETPIWLWYKEILLKHLK